MQPPTATSMRVRPRFRLFRDGLLACVVFITPVFVVAYWQTAGTPRLALVVALHALATLLVTVAGWRYFAVGVWIDDVTISERGFFSRRRTFQRSAITSVLRATTFGNGAEPVQQLFVRADDDRVVIRLRGQFWSTESMDAVVADLGVPTTELPATLSNRELAGDHPHLVYWFERNRVTAGIALGAAIGVVGAIALGLVALFG